MQFGFPILLLVGVLLGVVAVVGLAVLGARLSWGALLLAGFVLLLAVASEALALVWLSRVRRIQRDSRYQGSE
jgi:hypothetical protein